MWSIFEIVIDLAIAWCSWRLSLCIILALGIIAGVYYKYPEHNGFWPLTSLIGLIIVAYGVW